MFGIESLSLRGAVETQSPPPPRITISTHYFHVRYAYYTVPLPPLPFPLILCTVLSVK